MLSSSERGLLSAIGVSRALFVAGTIVSEVVDHLSRGDYGWTSRACKRALERAGSEGLERALEREAERADSPIARGFFTALATAQETGTSPREELEGLFSMLSKKKRADTQNFIEKASLGVNVVLVLVLVPLLVRMFSVLESAGIGGNLGGLTTPAYAIEMVLISCLVAVLWVIKPGT